jgi:nicotinamidase-related amidase
MPELSHIDPRSAALLVMDYQVDTLTRFMTVAQSADVIACVPELIATARDAGMMVIHVVVAFRPGHPEVSPRNDRREQDPGDGLPLCLARRRSHRQDWRRVPLLPRSHELGPRLAFLCGPLRLR